MPYPRTPRTKPLFPSEDRLTPAHYLIAHSDGGAAATPAPPATA